jgi:hypothetical protein
MTMSILAKLEGGDRRSIGNSEEVVQTVSKNPALFEELFSGLLADDPVVRMRAADAIEKITRARPELLQPWKNMLLSTASAFKEKELRWHVAQLIPRLRLTGTERKLAEQILMDYLEDGSSIVKTFSMQALVELAAGDEHRLTQLTPLIERLARTGTAAMRSRGRKLLKQLRRRSSE